jgi:hypothetical protein
MPRFSLRTLLIVLALGPNLGCGPSLPVASNKRDQMANKCPDCEAASGQMHEFFCSKERCPFCEGQLISCGCIATVLKLNDEERRVVELYEDDSEEPLAGIIQRWKRALAEKGRIPVR